MQTVEDYEVTGICNVYTLNDNMFVQNKNAVYGKGYLHFKKKDNEFTVEVDSYTDNILLKNQMPIYNGCLIEVPYNPHKFHEINDMLLLESESPFFFFDIDFDGENELVVTSWFGMNFRGHNAYDVYDIIETDNPHSEIIPIKKSNIPPLDDFTQIDTLNKRIIIPFDFYSCPGNPYFCGEELIYEAKPYAMFDFVSGKIKYTNDLVLKEHIEYDWSEYNTSGKPIITTHKLK